jgi:phosphoglycerate dehydrogenase-like enzyme
MDNYIAKVVSMIPKERFIDTQIELPDDMEFIFLPNGTEDEIIKICQGADFILAYSAYSRISKNIIDNIPTIKLIQVEGAGFDKVDYKAAADVNLPVANNVAVNAKTVSEYTICLMIALLRRLSYVDKEIKEKKYKEVQKSFLPGSFHELGTVKVGLVGLGAVGQHVAKLAKAFEADVYYYDPVDRKEIEKELGVTSLSYEELLRTCDIVSLHVPLNPKTKDLIGKKEVMMMKKDAILINTSRGQVINQEELAEVLEMGYLGGVGIDTFYPEPPEDNHPLLKLSSDSLRRVIFSPHIAGVTYGAYRNMLLYSINNMYRALNNEPLKNVVNGIQMARSNKV